jgi:hypothetical protein
VIEDVLAPKSKDDALAGGGFTGSTVCANTDETPSAVVASATLKPARITLLIADIVIYSSNSDFTAPDFRAQAPFPSSA